MEIAIIGTGRLGGALALALARKNYVIRQLVTHRRPISKIADLIIPAPEILSFDELEKISADVIFITTPDSEIQTTAQKLAAKLKNKSFVFHTSGALSSEILQSLEQIGCVVASLHPLVSISDPAGGAENFGGAFFCLEGTPAAVELAGRIVTDLEGKSFMIPTEFKTLYHASAVMASGNLVSVFSIAVEILAACGLTAVDAQKILLPLVASTVKNLATRTPAQALTGPFARADVETIKMHLAALEKNVSESILEIYRQLGRRSLQLAENQGAKAEILTEIESLLARNIQ